MLELCSCHFTLKRDSMCMCVCVVCIYFCLLIYLHTHVHSCIAIQATTLAYLTCTSSTLGIVSLFAVVVIIVVVFMLEKLVLRKHRQHAQQRQQHVNNNNNNNSNSDANYIGVKNNIAAKHGLAKAKQQQQTTLYSKKA